MEETLQIQLPVLLPGLPDQRDACVERLESSVKNRKGILRAHVKYDAEPAVLCLHYDPNLVSIQDLRQAAQRAGAAILNRYRHEIIDIVGMDCADCAIVVQHGISRMDGVLSASLNYPLGKLRVEYDSRRVTRSAIEKRIHSLGYTTPPSPLEGWYFNNRELLFSLAAGLLLLTGWAGERFLGLPGAAALVLFLFAILLGGWDVAQHAWGSIKERQFNTDLLMVVAALGAAALGEFAEGALLIFLFSLGHALEERALDKARNAIRALQDLAPATALVRREGLEHEVPVESLVTGEIVIVRPGVRIPADGAVTAGQSAVNQAPVTGESLPVEKAPGDQVFAGTVNGDGSLEISVTRAAADSTLARVMKMVEEAQTQKSPTQATVERFTAVFVPGVLAITLLVIAIPPLFGVPFKESFLRGMTLLVAASPCALALGTPSAILAGVAQAARGGILVKGGMHLENLGRLKAIALDKTGTLTYGRPEVTDVIPLDGVSQNELVELAARVESRSAHPLAEAVLRRQGAALPPDGVAGVESLTGRGLKAKVDGEVVWIGTEKLMEEAGISLESVHRQTVRALKAEGKTTILVAREGRLLGALALEDTLRATAADAIARVKKLGVDEVALLTGDHREVAEAIALRVGITSVYASLMPEDKQAILKRMLAAHRHVAMIGDGVNDAPALATASVGIAMGGASTDVALETADVALMGDDLSRLPFAIGVGRATRAIIVQNLWISLSVIALLGIASLAGLAGIGIAVAIHEGSTLVVVMNSLRLLAYREE